MSDQALLSVLWFITYQLTESLFLQSAGEDEAAGSTMRDRSHIEDTLRLATAEPSEKFSGKEQIHLKITDIRICVLRISPPLKFNERV